MHAGGKEHIAMRAFILSAIAAIVLALGAAWGLSFLQETSARAYIGDSVRFNQEERVNAYGREG